MCGCNRLTPHRGGTRPTDGGYAEIKIPPPICASALIEEADKPRRPCSKRFRLVLWWLTYRLPVLDGVNKETEELARKHCKYSKQDWARDQVSARNSLENGALRRLAKRCPPDISSAMPNSPLGQVAKKTLSHWKTEGKISSPATGCPWPQADVSRATRLPAPRRSHPDWASGSAACN